MPALPPLSTEQASVALISASLLLLATLWAAYRIRPLESGQEYDQVLTPPLRRRRKLLPWLASLLLHTGAIVVAIFQVGGSRPSPLDLRRYQVMLVDLRSVETPLYLPAFAVEERPQIDAAPEVETPAEAPEGPGLEGQSKRDQPAEEAPQSSTEGAAIALPPHNEPVRQALPYEDVVHVAAWALPRADRSALQYLASLAPDEFAGLPAFRPTALRALEVAAPPALPGSANGISLAAWLDAMSWSEVGESEQWAGLADSSSEGRASGKGGAGEISRRHRVVIISDQAAAAPEIRQTLTGNRIYTIYVDAPGWPHRMALHVAAPGGQGGRLEQRGHVYRMLPGRRIDPPYAIQKTPLLLASDARVPFFVWVGARIDERGELNDLRIVSAVQPETAEKILASLGGWLFQPALADGEPIEVEALFGVRLR